MRLRDVLKPGKTTIDYLYDFGDSWMHRLTVTGVRPGKVLVELPFPAAHLPQLERYLSFYWPWLCCLTGHRNPAYPFCEPGNRIWIAKTGAAMSEEVFYKNINKLTTAAFGHPISPHLFRNCLATSIAIHDPHHVHITRVLLGHKTSTTAEKFRLHSWANISPGSLAGATPGRPVVRALPIGDYRACRCFCSVRSTRATASRALSGVSHSKASIRSSSTPSSVRNFSLACAAAGISLWYRSPSISTIIVDPSL